MSWLYIEYLLPGLLKKYHLYTGQQRHQHSRPAPSLLHLHLHATQAPLTPVSQMPHHQSRFPLHRSLRHAVLFDDPLRLFNLYLQSHSVYNVIKLQKF